MNGIPFHKNQIVKGFGSVGVVRAVFTSPDTDEIVIWIYFVKNAHRMQEGDIVHLLPERAAELILPATVDELQAEIERYQMDTVQKLESAFQQVLEMESRNMATCEDANEISNTPLYAARERKTRNLQMGARVTLEDLADEELHTIYGEVLTVADLPKGKTIFKMTAGQPPVCVGRRVWGMNPDSTWDAAWVQEVIEQNYLIEIR